MAGKVHSNGNGVLGEKTRWRKAGIVVRYAGPDDIKGINEFLKELEYDSVEIAGSGFGLIAFGGINIEEDEDKVKRQILYELSNNKIVIALERNKVVGEGIFSKGKLDFIGILKKYRKHYKLFHAITSILFALSKTSRTWTGQIVSEEQIKMVEAFKKLGQELELKMTIEKSPINPLIVDIKFEAKDTDNFDDRVIKLLEKYGWMRIEPKKEDSEKEY